jgi:hypothetical protein
MAEQLVDEGRVFEEHLAEWREEHMGQFVLIKGEDVLGFFGSLEEAFRTGTERFGLQPFFVKQIIPADSINVTFFGQRILV